MSVSAQTSTFQQNTVPAEPALADLLNLLRKDIFLSLNCHAIGTIQSFDPESQTAEATINYPQTYFEFIPPASTLIDDGVPITNTTPVSVSYPALIECPVVIMGGGSGAITFPIAPGDECIILFNDRDMDNWFSSGSTGSAVATPRLHSFSDGLILVGISSMPNVWPNYDTSRAVIRGNIAGTTRVAVGETLINIQNDSFTLKDLLQQLISNVKDLVTATAAITVTSPIVVSSTPFTGTTTSGTPNNAAAINAAATELTTTANQIAELLD